MAQDFRHGHGRHRQTQFKRKSQQTNSKATKQISVSMIWIAGFAVSAIVLIGFFVTQHFVNQVQQEQAKPVEKSIYLAAKELQEKATESVEEVTEKLEPKPVVVEAVNVVEEERLVEQNSAPRYSFYEGLAKTEVVVDAVPISVQLEQPYYIQAGTFGSERIALKEKARLEKLGQTLDLSTYQGTKKLYFRLRVGPFSDRLTLNKRRNELRRLGVDTLLVKAPKPAQ